MLIGSYITTFDKYTEYQIPNVKAKVRLKRPHEIPLLQVKSSENYERVGCPSKYLLHLESQKSFYLETDGSCVLFTASPESVTEF